MNMVETTEKTILVGCKLPHGLIIEDPADVSKKVKIHGLNRSKIIGASYAATRVDRELWDRWIVAHKDFSAVVSGAIFAAKNANDIQAIGKENENRKTGFEPAKEDDFGVTPATEKDEE